MYGDRKQTVSGACHRKALPSFFFVCDLASVVCMAGQHGESQATIAFSLNGCGERTDSESIYLLVTANNETPHRSLPQRAGPHAKYILRHALKGWEKKFHTHDLHLRLGHETLILICSAAMVRLKFFRSTSILCSSWPIRFAANLHFCTVSLDVKTSSGLSTFQVHLCGQRLPRATVL